MAKGYEVSGREPGEVMADAAWALDSFLSVEDTSDGVVTAARALKDLGRIADALERIAAVMEVRDD